MLIILVLKFTKNNYKNDTNNKNTYINAYYYNIIIKTSILTKL